MGLLRDWYRGAKNVSNQRQFDSLCKRLAEGKGEPGDEHIARALAVKLGIQAEPERKRRR